MFDPHAIKKDFPIFTHHPELVYLDSAATSLTPRCVIEKLREYYEQYNANIARGVYRLAERATMEFEETRDVVARFINAPRAEIIFTRGTTESLNLVAATWGREQISRGDGVVVTAMDHHANFVPWQMLAQEKKASFRVIPLTPDGHLDENSFPACIDSSTKIVAIPLVSNVLGTIVPAGRITKKIRKIAPHAVIIVDAAQAAPHQKIDVKKIDCDFLAFSGHKMFGPTGVGVLWGRAQLLAHMSPYQFGGEMISSVTMKKSTFAPPPQKFEAGTPAIADVIALKEAIRYIEKIGFDAIRAHEQTLTAYAMERLMKTFGTAIRIFGPRTATKRCDLISFTFKNYHPHDIAHILDKEKNVCVRAGHHCAMPLHVETLCISASARASFSIYNAPCDVDALVDGLLRVDEILGAGQ